MGDFLIARPIDFAVEETMDFAPFAFSELFSAMRTAVCLVLSRP